jgi:hypothetical protein
MTRRTTPHALRRPALPAPDDEPESTDRPTVNPPFDVSAFARESESKLRALSATQPKVRVPVSGVAAALTHDTPVISESTIEDPLGEMRQRFALGDYGGSLELAEVILAGDPSNVDAAECGEDCRTLLESRLVSALGSLDQVPMVSVPRSQLLGLSLDHRAGFVLSLVDGSSTLEMILDVCGMPRLDGLQIVQELVRQKIVAFR